MKDSNVFFSSGDGTLKTVSSSVYFNQAVVEELVKAQNEKADDMGIAASYRLTTCLKSELPSDVKVRS